ncbi:hypothetical protein ARMSODRAFT_1005605 [Armillaria solidipes]|uniref:Uncharacterized protein n=1 Tax=Armillaria solidipes TaxID=1076256 RepID=A0A2H3B8W7_9AGAR|nr:hypothetical protein ARMSODRAFT_1005605 [Armillaria solidipes]
MSSLNPVPLDLFVFPGTKPEWAAQTANLVSLDAQPFYYTPGTFKRLAHVSTNREDTLAWLKHEHKTVFWISSIDSSAPVLLFALKLTDGSLIWVFLSVRLDGTTEKPLAESEVRDAFANLQPERVLYESEVEPSPESDAPPGGSDVNVTTAEKTHADDLEPAVGCFLPLDPIPAATKAATLGLPSDIRELLDALPNRRVDVGNHSMRVLASLRADPQLDRISPDSSLASLNVQYVQSVTKMFSPKDLLEDVANATTFSKYAGVKRKCVDDGPVIKRQRFLLWGGLGFKDIGLSSNGTRGWRFSHGQ